MTHSRKALLSVCCFLKRKDFFDEYNPLLFFYFRKKSFDGISSFLFFMIEKEKNSHLFELSNAGLKVLLVEISNQEANLRSHNVIKVVDLLTKSQICANLIRSQGSNLLTVCSPATCWMGHWNPKGPGLKRNLRTRAFLRLRMRIVTFWF